MRTGGALISLLWRLKQRITEDNLSVIAAGVAFYAMLAVFPALIALVGLYGIAFDARQVDEQVSRLTAMLPPQAAQLIGEQVGEIASIDRSSLRLGSIVALLVALWSASAGVRALMTALNVAYDEEEKRGLVRFYATSLVLTLAAVVGAALAIGLIVAVPAALRFAGLGALAEGLIDYARWPLLALLMLAGLAIMYLRALTRAPGVALAELGRGQCGGAMAGRFGALFALRERVRKLQQDLRLARRGSDPAPLVPGHRVRNACRRRTQR